jgi:hypothetical protein
MLNVNLRYEGKPFLRLLECYVLWAIGELAATEANTLEEMTPKLQAIYGVQGNWQQIVAVVMEFPSNIPDTIRRLWANSAEISRKNRTTITPQQFAEAFVDQNLVR